MLLALVLAASLTDWVPARWISNDPKSLPLLKDTPINCLLLERPQWSQSFAQQAARQGIVTLGVIHPGAEALESARQANILHFAGVVMEGTFEAAAEKRIRSVLSDSNIKVVELATRARMRFDSTDPVLGTFQGLWPGVRAEENGTAQSGPSGAPWINTNTGFLRFARAATDSTVWIGNQPPEHTAVNVSRYLQAIGDAAMTGARWVVALDGDFAKRLLTGDAGRAEGLEADRAPLAVLRRSQGVARLAGTQRIGAGGRCRQWRAAFRRRAGYDRREAHAGASGPLSQN